MGIWQQKKKVEKIENEEGEWKIDVSSHGNRNMTWIHAPIAARILDDFYLQKIRS